MIDQARLARIHAVGEAPMGVADAPVPADHPAPVLPRWHRCPDLVDLILARAREPMVTFRLGADEIVTVRSGGMVVVMGPTGAGKTSFVVGMLAEHDGPVIVLSRELPADELAARMVGAHCDASWLDVLTGKVPRGDMERALNLPRMYVLDRRDATLARLVEAIQAAKAEHPGEPIVVAIDYAQILESTEKDARAKVADVVAQIDEILRAERVVGLLVSQMSRAASRAAQAGESMGALSTDGGAESAAIERAATVTLCIGAAGPVREDGTRAVDLSIGKGRMTGGDRVVPMSYCGRSGRWRVAGEARATTDVLAERAAQHDSAKVETAKLAMLGFAAKAKAPFSREDIKAKARCSKVVGTAAIEALLESGELVEVRKKKPRSSAWLMWTPSAASEAGISVLDGDS